MKTLLLAAALALSFPGPGHAGRPLMTEDAGILERGDCELEGAAGRVREPGAASATAGTLQLACGVGAGSQLALAVQRARSGGDRVQGLRLGGKSELWRGPGDAAAAFTLAWGLAGAKARGATWEHAETALTGVLSLPLPDAALHVNLGHVRDEIGHGRRTAWGLAWEHDGGGTLAPMAEVVGDDRTAPWWNLGLRWTALPRRLTIDASYGRQMTSWRPSQLTAGFKLML